ncbi:hypothetical protein [Bradyrhizobium glycinis]|uniref:hypothetical protein n=1 Tax=Bradyrhizobium glycinis TaxID=2751812 RepID=UPI0018D6677C|nr:hypothetical protein [Bradyrhizobium glycinis]MBH5371648.1 hypothetical protein [Bradyrhizobium glycinis]
MQQVFFRKRASRAIDAAMRIDQRAIASRKRFADSESRFLATKIFSCLTARALAGARSSRRFGRIARRRFAAASPSIGMKFAVRGCARASHREPKAR